MLFEIMKVHIIKEPSKYLQRIGVTITQKSVHEIST